MCLKYDKKMSLECLINHIKAKEDFPLIEILNYAKILKKNRMCNPSACISYLRDILSVYDDEFPADLIVDNDNCPVCDEAYQLFLPCRHVICKRCYYHLVDKKCPICRYVIDENLIKKRIV